MPADAGMCVGCEQRDLVLDYVRTSTKMWTFWCSFWFFFLSVSVKSGLGLNPCNKCNTALGLEDLRIQDSQLTAQSFYERLSIGGGKAVDTEPKCARLNKNNCAWCAPRGNGQYLQVDLHRNFIITGIATQGFEGLSDYYVTRYKVFHSRNGHTWSIFPQVMRGNHDGRSVVRHNFSSPMYTRYIRIYPVAYRYRICMRMELYGCSNSSSALSTTPSPTTLSAANNTTPENVPRTTGATAASRREKPMSIHSTTDCNSALGLEDLRIQDSQLTAQSHYESLSIGDSKAVKTHPKCARLNNNNCAWCGPRGNGQYLQVDLRRDFVITGIATQGFDYFVRSYNLSHSRDGHTWSIFPLVMRGNHDGRSVVRHTFIPPMYTRYIRVHPIAYSSRICVRMELYGCSNSTSVVSTTPSATTQSTANNTTHENVPPINRATAESSTEKPMIIHQTTNQPVGSDKLLITTPKAKETLPSERHTLQTGNVATQMAKDDSKKHSFKTLLIALVVVSIAVVVIICSLVWFYHLQERKHFSSHHCPGNEIEVQLLRSSV